MNKHLLTAALAMGALIAGGQAGQTTRPTDNAPVEGKTISVTVDGRTVPVKSVTFSNQPEQTVVAVRARPIYPALHRIERPGRRKVKYGKSRWIILG